MRTLTATSADMGRRQLEIERDLIAQGMDPREASTLAALNVMPASGNGAELDNLAGAATPLSVEAELGGPAGRVAPPQSERVYRDDPTMGMAGMLAAREEAQAMRDAEREAIYGQRHREYVDKYGMIGTPGAAPLTQDQQDARAARTLREAEARHTPRQEDARIASLAARAGIPVEKAAEMVQAGYDEYAQQKNVQPWTVAGSNNTTEVPDLAQMNFAHRALRQAGDTRRQDELAERKQAVIRRRMAQSNPLEYLNRDDISDWNRRVVADQMLRRGYRAGEQDGNDPRIRVAEITAASADAQAAAEREARISQQQWLENTRIAAEERAAARSEQNAIAQRNFDSEQKRLEREAAASQGNSARAAANELRQKDLDDARLKHEELMGRMTAADAEAARRHEAALAESKGQFSAQQQQFDAKYGLDEKRLDQAKKEADDLKAKLESEALLKPMEVKYGEGVRAIVAGDYGTPAAEDSLKAMAQDSDAGWFGFWEADGKRMDAILSRLGVTDQDARRALVERFGYGSPGLFPGSGDGRGGLLSYWLAGRQ